MNLTCPVCKEALTQNERNLRCINGHSFDAARQGYWNLLLVQKKRSLDPGDNPAMVQARRRFLDLGFYQLLSERINQLATAQLSADRVNNILDMGCGEGYYTQRLEHHLDSLEYPSQITGLDISKHAVKAACQRSKKINWLVASGADIPLPEQTLDLQMVLFSRLMPDAFARPMKPNSALLVAWPGPQHLIELRQLIYAEIKESQFDPATTLAPAFEQQSIEQVSYKFTLKNAEEINALLAMTPHGQHLSTEARERLDQLDHLELTLDVNLGLFTCT